MWGGGEMKVGTVERTEGYGRSMRRRKAKVGRGGASSTPPLRILRGPPNVPQEEKCSMLYSRPCRWGNGCIRSSTDRAFESTPAGKRRKACRCTPPDSSNRLNCLQHMPLARGRGRSHCFCCSPANTLGGVRQCPKRSYFHRPYFCRRPCMYRSKPCSIPPHIRTGCCLCPW